MTAFIIIVVVFILLLAIVPGSSKSHMEGQELPDITYNPPRREPREKNHFINSYLHRNDERNERHKRNQTPW